MLVAPSFLVSFCTFNYCNESRFVYSKKKAPKLKIQNSKHKYLTLYRKLTCEQPQIMGKFIVRCNYDAFTTFVKLRSPSSSKNLRGRKRSKGLKNETPHDIYTLNRICDSHLHDIKHTQISPSTSFWIIQLGAL